MTILIIVLAIGFQVFLTAKKISPFLSLLIVAILAGLLLGMQPADLLVAIEKGAGSTLGGLALIICLGAAMGKILEVSGAAAQISLTLISSFGQNNIQWAVLTTGFLIGIPLYYNAGFIILVPLVFSIAKSTRLPLLYIAIPMAASLSTTHCFLPPHPGPVVLVNAFHADMGKTLVYGLIIAIPAVIIAGPVLGRIIRYIGSERVTNEQETAAETISLPPRLPSFFIALLPVLLIGVAVLARHFLAEGSILRTVLLFTGDSTIALLMTVILAAWLLGTHTGRSVETVMQWLTSAISGIAMILLIITAGGVLKQVLIDSGTARYFSSFSSKWEMPPLIFGWLATALLRVTIGSATVAGITAAGVVLPLVASGQASPELMVLAVGSGSVFGSHVNDSGFWMFKEFFGLSMKQTFLSWTVMETLISISGLIGVLLLDMVVK